MNKLIYSIIFALPLNIMAQVGIGTQNPHVSSILDVTSTSKGILLPRMTSAEMNDILTPSPGLMIYNTDEKCLAVKNNSIWHNLCNGDPIVYISPLTSEDQFNALLFDNVPNSDPASTVTTIKNFGHAIEMSSDGSTVVIGAPKTDVNIGTNQNEAGAAFVLRRQGSNWVEQISITSQVPGGLDHFGSYVSISGDGNTIAVGAPNDDHTLGTGSGTGRDRGFVYIYTFDGTNWSTATKLNVADAGQDFAFGTSVSLNDAGDAFIAGAPGTEAVYYYKLVGNTWTETQKVQPNTIVNGDRFGHSVDLSADGNSFVVGANKGDHGNGGGGGLSNRGDAYVFRYSSSWAQEHIFFASDALADDEFGSDVAISANGNTIVVGAELDDHNLNNTSSGSYSNRGSAYIFQYELGSWSEQQQIFGSQAAWVDKFGGNLVMSNDGKTIGVGLYEDDHGQGTGGGSNRDRGSAYVFRLDGSTWSETKVFNSKDASQDDQFGSGLGMSQDGNKFVIGARQNNDTGIGSGSGSGSIYIFN